MVICSWRNCYMITCLSKASFLELNFGRGCRMSNVRFDPVVTMKLELPVVMLSVMIPCSLVGGNKRSWIPWIPGLLDVRNVNKCFGEMMLMVKQSTRMPLRSPQIPHGISRGSALRDRRLTPEPLEDGCRMSFRNDGVMWTTIPIFVYWKPQNA
jgi:hypothetical protein